MNPVRKECEFFFPKVVYLQSCIFGEENWLGQWRSPHEGLCHLYFRSRDLETEKTSMSKLRFPSTTESEIETQANQHIRVNITSIALFPADDRWASCPVFNNSSAIRCYKTISTPPKKEVKKETRRYECFQQRNLSTKYQDVGTIVGHERQEDLLSLFERQGILLPDITVLFLDGVYALISTIADIREVDKKYHEDDGRVCGKGCHYLVTFLGLRFGFKYLYQKLKCRR